MASNFLPSPTSSSPFLFKSSYLIVVCWDKRFLLANAIYLFLSFHEWNMRQHQRVFPSFAIFDVFYLICFMKFCLPSELNSQKSFSFLSFRLKQDRYYLIAEVELSLREWKNCSFASHPDELWKWNFHAHHHYPLDAQENLKFQVIVWNVDND